MLHLKQFESYGNSHYVYRGSRDNKPVLHDDMFFSVDQEYARSIGGSYVKLYLIRVQRPLILEKYNVLFRKAGIYPLGQDLLTIHNSFIREGYQSAIEHMYIQGFKKESYEFEKELKTCDSIFGEGWTQRYQNMVCQRQELYNSYFLNSLHIT